MVINKSLDDSEIIAALLQGVSDAHGLVFNNRSRRLTLQQVKRRLAMEGIGFLTKTMPRLAKAIDIALAGGAKLSASKLGFSSQPNSELPRFLGELINLVFSKDGTVLPQPCANCVKVLREVLYLYYKYELPYTEEQEQQVIQKFEKTEDDLSTRSTELNELEATLERYTSVRRNPASNSKTPLEVAREARILLSRLFASFDPLDIKPRHGPGAVATKQRLWHKYHWTNVAGKITDLYPFDAYFMASNGHVCDEFHSYQAMGSIEHSAKVILVPKDSRGPRLISCEPVDFQWIQQGLGRAIVELVERHPLTKWNVHFTDQSPNQFGALLGSKTGGYATIDLNEASDRVSVGLVRLLFPKHVYTYLEGSRSSSTLLPNGKVLKLSKFAPMGSCLCFPVLALTIWAILTAAASNADTRERILVYGDDVIVPTAFAGDAMEHLESFGLKVNRDKSCISGFFRESCGTDAFKGINVTPVRLRTVWSSTPRPDVYSSWISYANSFFDRRYYRVYELIMERLVAIYGPIPSDDMNLSCPSLRWVPDEWKPKRRRYNKSLQKLEYRVRDVRSPVIRYDMKGWSMLLRYFVEAGTDSPLMSAGSVQRKSPVYTVDSPFSVSSYTDRKTSMLVMRWR